MELAATPHGDPQKISFFFSKLDLGSAEGGEHLLVGCLHEVSSGKVWTAEFDE